MRIKLRYVAIICFSLILGKLDAQHQVSGYIKDAATGESLIGATIWQPALKIGANANQYGFYSLSLPFDSATLEVRFVGYEPNKLFINLKEDTILNFHLKLADELSEVVVKAARPNVALAKMSSMTIQATEIKSIPALMGEVDVLKAIQLMPGIQSGSEGSSGIYVRGGGPDQNLILLDGVPVYNASHLFGFFSVFNADAINSVEVIKGGFPARYGGRLSSVIDINMKEGNMQQWQVDGGVGIIASRLSVEGPIKKNKASIILSGRRTYIDLLARPIIKASSQGSADVGYYFYDFNGKANYILSEKDRLYVSTYTGTDRFYAKDSYGTEAKGNSYSEDEAGIYWGNVTTALRWNHLVNNKLFVNTTATFSKYGFNLFNESYSRSVDVDTTYENAYYAKYNSGIQDYGVRFDFDYYHDNKHSLKFGMQYIYHIFQAEAFNYTGDFEEDDSLFPDSSPIYGNEYAIYLEDEIIFNERFKANVGLHSSAFYVNKSWYTSFQPRLTGRYMLKPNLSIKASYAQMAQYLHLLTNSGIGLPTDLWVPVTENVKPQLSTQYAIGLHQSLADNTYELSFETYYKKMDNLIAYKEGSNFLDVTEDWETKITSGNGWSYGGEFLLRKKRGQFNGWIGYTLSWNNRQFESLNFGKVFPYKYDRRHDISLVMSYKVSDNFEINGTWVYGTGNAITLPITRYPAVEDPSRSGEEAYQQEVYQYSDRNAYRMPAYHRGDLGLSWHKRKKWGEATWNLSVYNFYNRKNPFAITTTTNEDGSRRFEQLSIFQIIPSLSYSFKIRPNVQ